MDGTVAKGTLPVPPSSFSENPDVSTLVALSDMQFSSQLRNKMYDATVKS